MVKVLCVCENNNFHPSLTSASQAEAAQVAHSVVLHSKCTMPMNSSKLGRKSHIWTNDQAYC